MNIDELHKLISHFIIQAENFYQFSFPLCLVNSCWYKCGSECGAEFCYVKTHPHGPAHWGMWSPRLIAADCPQTFGRPCAMM